MIPVLLNLLAVAAILPLTAGHVVPFFHPSMWGFNVTAQTFPYDNRPVAPLVDYTFNQWWFHGHLDHPPNPGDFFELPAGKPATSELACDKGATSYFASDPGGNIQSGDNVCPGSPIAEFHTTGFDDLKGCALAIAYKDDVTQVQPADFTVFSVNQTCVWTRFTDFQVPAKMPPCPSGGCICAFFWIHSPDSGGEQNYMNGFKCNVTGATSNVALAEPQVPRRCGADPANGKPNASPGNCTYGAKNPFYWFQAEQNNMFEGTYSPPFYTDLYNFKDGPQDDIFQDSYPNGIPAPSPNSTTVPTPNLGGGNQAAPTPASSAPSAPASSAPASSSSSVSASSGPSSPAGNSSAAISASPSSPPSSSATPSVSLSTVTVVSTLVVTVTDTIPTSSAGSVSSTVDSPLPTSAPGVPSASPPSSIPVASSSANSSGSSASTDVSSGTANPPAATTIPLNNPSVTPIASPSASAAVTGTGNAALVVAGPSSTSDASNATCGRSRRRSHRRRLLPDELQEREPVVAAGSRSVDGGLRGDKHLTVRSRLWRVW
ncbi:hypothetical protein B0H21DRAFT_732796 [Amylocystis lapponica]|nr:hypothetical protein B0H21DRAFT_732796 [Amylocystis lapponica]